MKADNVRYLFMTSHKTILLVGVFLIACVAIAVPLNTVRSDSTAKKANVTSDKVVQPPQQITTAALKLPKTLALVTPPPDSPEGIATYAANCTTAKTDFNLGETVCIKASGVPVTLFPWGVLSTDTAGFVRQADTAIADDSTTYQYTLPSNATSIVNSETVDNRGTWRISLARSNGAIRQTALITVHQPANPAVDVFVQKLQRDGESVSTGGSIAFLVVVANEGPDSAQSVHLVDSTPSGATLVSFTQQNGPACAPADTNNCTIASLMNGERAEFTAIYQVSTAGTSSTSATVSSTTADTDNSNNSAQTEFEVAAGGSPSQCSLLCPTSLTFNEDPGAGGHTVAAADLPDPTTTGTCGDVSSTAVPNAQGNYFFPVGVSVITVSTESGEECTYTVTVTDTQDPVIDCPSDITVFESSPGSGSAVVNYNVTATDNSGHADIICSQPSGDTFPVGTTSVNCTATDSANNSATCSFEVTVNSSNNTCTLTTPSPITVNSPANACGTNVTFTPPTSDGSGTCGTITCDHASGSFFPVGETVVTCTSSPDGGNTSFTVTVNDVTPPTPTLSSLPTLTGDCSVTAGVPTVIQTPTGPKTVIDVPTASDNCGGLISGSTNDQRTYDVPGTYTVTWDYTDVGGNTVSQTQTVIVNGNDTSVPVPDAATLPTVTGECSVTLDPPTATDNCAGTVSGTTANLEITGAGSHTVQWTYTDASGNSSTQNQTVVITDTHAPTIALEGPASVTVECHTSFEDPGVTTDDNCVPKNVTVSITNAPNVNQPGTYIVTYTATDGGGNQASVQRTVTVEDTIKPVISLTGGNMTVECHTSFTDPGASASDSCDSNVPVTVSGSVDINTPGTYVLTYSASDDSGNQANSVQRTVTVVDTTAPVINLTSYAPSMWPPNHDYQTFTVANFVASVTDSCDTSLGLGGVVIEKVTSDEVDDGAGDGSTVNDMVISGDCKSVQLRAERSGSGDGRLYTITFRVRDASGNTTRATAQVKVAHNPGEAVIDSGVKNTVNGTCP